MKITCLYFFSFCAVHSVESFLLKIMDKMMSNNVSNAFLLNYICIVKFISSMAMPYFQMKLKNHKLILSILYSSFILGLIFCNLVLKMEETKLKYCLSVIALIFYNIGTGSIFTMLEFIKINSLAKIRALHSVTILSVGCCLGSGIGNLPSAIIPRIYTEGTVEQYLLIYMICAIIFAIICILLTIFFCPDFDYSPNFNYDRDPLETKNTNKLNFNQSMIRLLKLLRTSFSIFVFGVCLLEALQSIIKLLLRHFSEHVNIKPEITSTFQLLRIVFQVSIYFCLLKVKKEKYIYIYYIICCIFCCLRPTLFFIANKNNSFSLKLCAFQSALTAAESGFQQLSISRICNNITPSDIKVYAHGFYLAIRNGLGPLLGNFICQQFSNKNAKLTQIIYNRIFFCSILMAIITLAISIILFLINYKKSTNNRK